MASYSTTVRTAMSPPDAFAYMADLRNFEHWDPGVSSVFQMTGTGGSPNSMFDVDVSAGIGTMTLRYVTTDYQPNRTVTVEAHSKLLTSIDRIDVEPDGSGSSVTYAAELRLNGPLSIFDLGLRLVFDRIGDRAADGLAEAIGRP